MIRIMIKKIRSIVNWVTVMMMMMMMMMLKHHLI